MRYSLINLLICSVIFISCVSFKNKNNENRAITTNKQAFHINNIETFDDVSIFDIVSNIEVIPLEDSQDIFTNQSFYRRYVALPDKYLVLDTKESELSIFDVNGKLIEKYEHAGRGPGEYVMSSDLNYNKITNRIEILNPSGSINVYDSLGKNFIETIRIPFPEGISAIHSFRSLSDSMYVFHAEYSDDKCLYTFNRSNNELILFGLYHPREVNFTGMANDRPFYFFKDSLRYCQGWDGAVYNIDYSNNTSSAIFLWDFGKYQFHLSYLEKDRNIDYYVRYTMEKLKYATTFSCFTESKSNFITTFLFNKKWLTMLFNKKNNDYTIFEKTTEGVFFAPIYFDGDYAYSYLAVTSLKNYLPPDLLNTFNPENYDPESFVVIKYTLL